MDGATKTHVITGLAAFANRFRLPSVCVADSGPQLKHLDTNPIFDACRDTGITLEAVGASHQFLNFTERQVSVLKGLLESLRQFRDKTIYSQNDTLIGLYEKLGICWKIMGMRSILVKHEDGKETTLIAHQLAQPMMTSLQVESTMADLLKGKESTADRLSMALADYSSIMLSNFHELLLSYLQSNSVFYADSRTGLANKQQESGLVPAIGDFVTFTDGSRKIRFGVVTDVALRSNQGVVSLKMIKYGKPVEKNVHQKLLRLVYRRDDFTNPANIEKEPSQPNPTN